MPDIRESLLNSMSGLGEVKGIVQQGDRLIIRTLINGQWYRLEIDRDKDFAAGPVATVAARPPFNRPTTIRKLSVPE